MLARLLSPRGKFIEQRPITDLDPPSGQHSRMLSRECTLVIYNTVTYSLHSRTAPTPTDRVPNAPITTALPHQPRSS